jgi:hypothetical protein
MSAYMRDMLLSLWWVLQLMLVFHQTGFSFVYMDDERDAEDAIRGLDNVEFGRQHRRLRVEWAKVLEHTYAFHYVKVCCMTG